MRRPIVLVAAAAAAAMASGFTPLMHPAVQNMGASQSTPRRQTATGTTGGVLHPRRRGKGWSMAHVQRMKTKKRNRLRAKGQFRKAVR